MKTILYYVLGTLGALALWAPIVIWVIAMIINDVQPPPVNPDCGAAGQHLWTYRCR